MRLLVNGDEALRIDGGVALRRRQAGMAQQLLDGAEVAAARQQMRGETVPERVRRRRIRQAQRDAQLLHLLLYEARVERAAAGADEERLAGRKAPGTGGEIGLHRLGDL